MKLTVLGGSAAGSNTGAGCAGFLIQHNQTNLVLDLGPDILLELRKHVDIRNLTAIVISHYHLDHILDLGILRYFLAYNPIPAAAPIALHIPPESADRFRMWPRTFGHDDIDDFFAPYFEVSEYVPSESLTVDGLTISFAPTVHPTQGWAMRVTTSEGSSIGYTADTGPSANLGSFFQGVQLLISEATDRTPGEVDSGVRGHLTAFEAAQLAQDASAGMLMLTHMWEENGLERAVVDARSIFERPILVARPGLTVYL